MIKTITMVGAGNVATHLSLQLKRKGYKIQQVYSRTKESASKLASKLKTNYTYCLSEVNMESDMVIFAIKDAALEAILKELPIRNNFLVHCSGSMTMKALSAYSEKTAVLYPLQTFSKKREIVFDTIPLFVEANNQKNLEIIKQFANTLAINVHELNSDKRITLHIAAVFACNFVNHCYVLASNVLEQENISFDVLRPLINETAEKINKMHPVDAQTGPAVRFDENIIKKHLQYLHETTAIAALYKLMSESIYAHHNKKSS